jgi:DNA helicase-2/ATP-dependent DNA helicase PcrA
MRSTRLRPNGFRGQYRGLASGIGVTLVGDPRQCLLATYRGAKNKNYRGDGLFDWLDERAGICIREDRPESWRCHQAICEFASRPFSAYPPMVSNHDGAGSNHGVHKIKPMEVHEYVEAHRSQVLRSMKTTNTLGQPAINIGEAKGSAFDHVLIFTTGPMREYLDSGKALPPKSRYSLYVAVTRARHCVAFVVAIRVIGATSAPSSFGPALGGAGPRLPNFSADGRCTGRLLADAAQQPDSYPAPHA